MKKFYLFVFLLLNNVGLAQENTGFAVDLTENNIAGLFTMTDEGGRVRNLDLMENVFKDGTLGFKPERHHNVSSSFIYNSITDMANRVGENGTLLLYFNSHGGGSGSKFMMVASGGSFKFSKALQAIAKAKTVRRLIFFVDTCHAAGSIQESLKEDGELLRNIQNATPTKFLEELPEKYSTRFKPFLGIFDSHNGRIDFGEDSGAYEEILIISSSSVEDLTTRGVFASRMFQTFNSVKDDTEVTVGNFLKRFADSHGKTGQQPYYKMLPSKDMFNELLFGPLIAQKIPIKNHAKDLKKFDQKYIIYPEK
jgi:hypothetical protein